MSSDHLIVSRTPQGFLKVTNPSTGEVTYCRPQDLERLFPPPAASPEPRVAEAATTLAWWIVAFLLALVALGWRTR